MLQVTVSALFTSLPVSTEAGMFLMVSTPDVYKRQVFPYSRRSGTPAYDFPEQVHEREKQERSRVMNGIAEEVRLSLIHI